MTIDRWQGNENNGVSNTDLPSTENIFVAARSKVFFPPQLICRDEAKKGRSTRRVGLSRLKAIRQRDVLEGNGET